jgi:hypothetical protein
VVFDNDLNYKTVFDHVGAPWSLCITPGPHQYLYASNSNPDSQMTPIHEVTGQIFKMELDGKVLGKFGVPGKEQGQFSTVHGIDCRVENEILTTEITQWRLQKFLPRPPPRKGASNEVLTHRIHAGIGRFAASRLAVRRLALGPAERDPVRVGR